MSSAQLAPGTAIESFTVSGIARSRVGATTYEATDASGAGVQVTVYDATCFPSALVLERSLRELRQLQTVTHARVARVLGCGKLAGGGTWEAHASLPPQSLAEHLAAGPLAEADAIAIASQIGDALIEAQKVGVIHRSLGADVVFPSPSGVVVAGFAVGAPQGGKSFGPLDTIAPEQVEGKVVDQRTLIYNLAALLHAMLRGAPLFTGDAAAMLQAHLTQEPGADVAPALRRGLAKDPRVRPMMLRQFVTEISQGVGSAAPESGAPTSRGWTMFTSDAPAVAAAPTPAAAPAPAPTPAPAAAPAPAAPAAQADAAQPSTRGWTMFMQAADGEAPPASAPAATPAAAASTPAPAAPAAPAVPSDGSKPSTRGWTMFMQATDEPVPVAPTPAPAAPAPATPAVVEAASAAAAPAPATPAAAPSSRGWTMFTNASDADAPEPAASAATVPVAAPAPTPAAAAPPVAAPPSAAEPAKPSTRGWTMFTRDDEPPPAAAPTTASASAATPVEPVPPEGESGPPSSRGWTMFMEPGAAAAAAGGAGAAAATPAATAASTTPTPAATPVTEAEPPAGGQRRGWTMFMEAPIASAPQAQFGPTGVPPPPESAATAEPAVDTSSDNRGWTVFGAPSPVAAPADAAAPGEARTVVVTPAPAPVAHDASEGPMASGQVTSTEAPEPAPGRGRTVVAAGVSAVPGTVGGVTGRTVFPSGGQAPMPDTQYFRRGDIPPERPAQRTTAVDVQAPAGRPPVEERDAQRAAVPALGEPNLPERTGGSKTAILVVVGLAVVGTIVAIVAVFT